MPVIGNSNVTMEPSPLSIFFLKGSKNYFFPTLDSQEELVLSELGGVCIGLCCDLWWDVDPCPLIKSPVCPCPSVRGKSSASIEVDT